MRYNAIDRFYGVFNDSTQDSDEEKTLREAVKRLDNMLEEGQAGSIMTAQYLDHDTYEYEDEFGYRTLHIGGVNA